MFSFLTTHQFIPLERGYQELTRSAPGQNMKKKAASITILICLCLHHLSISGLCLDGNELVKLKKSGISDKVIQSIVKERTIETCAFTVREIIDLKQAGLSNKTLMMLLRESSFLKGRKPVVYGKELRSIKLTTARDIIELKDAGISNEIIQAIIIYGSRNVDDKDRENAWEMLKNMGIILDMR